MCTVFRENSKRELLESAKLALRLRTLVAKLTPAAKVHSVMPSFTPPNLSDVLEARKRLAPFLGNTPFRRHRSLENELGCEVFVKHENHNPTGSFKVRGGISLVSQLGPDEKSSGIISASTGNHGQSIALAGSIFGVKTTIVVPEESNPTKIAAIRTLGAEVIHHGADFDEARKHVEELSKKRGARYIHSANEPLLIAGVATYALEMLEAEPDLDVVLVPVGGGSGAAGCSLVMKTLAPHVQVIAVQAEAAPAAHLSWKEGRLKEARCSTFAEGLATRAGFELTQRMLREYLDDFVLVGEEELRDAILTYLEKTGTLAEGAGAASLAAAVKIRDRLQSKKVGLVLSGGNLSVEKLRRTLSGA